MTRKNIVVRLWVAAIMTAGLLLTGHGALGSVTLTDPAARTPAAPKQEVKIIFITNGGCILDAGTQKVAIDAICENPEPDRDHPPAMIAQAIDNCRQPFDAIDLMLATSSGEAQFGEKAVTAFLTRNQKTLFASTKDAVDQLCALAPAQVVGRLTDLTTDDTSTSMTLDHEGIRVRVFKEPPDGPSKEPGLAFFIEIGGKKIFYAGTSSLGFLEKGTIPNERVDAALLPTGYFGEIQDTVPPRLNEKVRSIKQRLNPGEIYLLAASPKMAARPVKLRQQLLDTKTFEQIFVFRAYRETYTLGNATAPIAAQSGETGVKKRGNTGFPRHSAWRVG